MPIQDTGSDIRLRGNAGDSVTDINEEINSADPYTGEVKLGEVNTAIFPNVTDGSVVTGRAMSEMQGESIFDSALPQTEAEGALGESLLFNGSNGYIRKAVSLQGNRKTFTLSFWVKIEKIDGNLKTLFSQGNGGTDRFYCFFNGNKLFLYEFNGSSYTVQHEIDHLIDASGWYHIVLAYDTTKSYAPDRTRAYVNGIESQLITLTEYDQNDQSYINSSGSNFAIGYDYGLSSRYFPGTIADFKFIDGKQLRPDSFGELVQGIWIPKAFNTASTDTLVTSNLIANYELNGDANDTSGSATTYNGTASNVTYYNTNYGIASFNGSNSYIDTGLNLSSSGGSVSMWINTTDTQGTFFGANANSDTNRFYFGVRDSNFWIGAGNLQVYTVSASNLIDGNWHNVILTLDGNTARYYLDGFEVASTGYTSGGNLNLNPVIGGIRTNAGINSSYYTNGKIGEVQVYSDTLTPSEVTQNYNATKHKYAYGLNGFWLPLSNTSIGNIDSGSNLKLHLDASNNSSYTGSGTSWLDLSGNSATATLNGVNFLSSTNGGVFDFDGSDDSVSLGQTNTVLPVNDKVTIEFWFNSDVTSTQQALITNTDGGGFVNGEFYIYRWNDNQLLIATAQSSTIYKSYSGSFTFTNNKWYHVCVTFDSTSSNIIESYINGVKDTSAALSGSGTFSGNLFNSTLTARIGKRNISGNELWFDGKIAQVRVYDKKLTSQEVISNYRATQGNYEQVSTVDISGNANSFTATNIDATDHIKDEPLDNYATFDPNLENTGGTLSEGNLKVVSSADTFIANKSFNSGKWYAEFTMGSTTNGYIAVFGTDEINPNMGGGWGQSGAIAYKQNGQQYSLAKGGSSVSASYGASYTTNDIIGVEVDVDGNTIEFYKNGVSQGQTTNGPSYIGSSQYSFAVYGSTSTITANFGQKPWAHGPSSADFLALSTKNLSAPAFDPDGTTPDKPSNYFKAVTYQGNGGTQGEAYGYKEGSRAAVFNGSSSKIDLGNNSSNNSSTISVSSWFKTSGHSGTATIINNGGANSQETGYFLGLTSSGYLRFNATGVGNIDGSVNYADGNWHNVIMTLNNGAYNVYVDGNTTPVITGNGAFTSTATRPTWIGQFSYTPSAIEFFNGSIDEVRIYSDVLTTTEVGYLADDDTTNIDAISNLVAHYDMEGDANDTGSYSYGTGTIDSGQSAVFNGNSSLINVGQRLLGGTHSASVWINTSTIGVRQTIIGNAYDGSTYGLSLFIETDNKLYLQWSHSNNWINVIDPTANRVNDGNWHHIAYFISAGSQKIYVDGIEVASGTVSTTAQNNTNAPTIIGRNWNASGYVNGKIDQVRIYSSVLSASDVEALASETNVPTANLVAHYKLDGDATDETTNNYDGTWGGTEAYSDPAEFPLVAYNGTDTNVTYTQDKPYGNIDVGFAPDFVWIKTRSDIGGSNHFVFDSIRGATNRIFTNHTLAEAVDNDSLTSFDSNGFTVGDDISCNGNGEDLVAWAWKAAGAANTYNVLENGTVTSDSTASGAGITAGTITTGWEVSANRDAGFSIVKYTANATSGATIGHGLGQELDLLIVKSTNLGQAWNVYVKDVTDTSSKYLRLNETSSISDLNTVNPRFIPNNFTDSVFSVGNDNSTNGISGTDKYIAYAFHSVDGFSKIGSYTGNASTTGGPFIYTGFKPAWIMIKQSSASGTRWIILDNARKTSNPATGWLSAEYTGTEQTDSSIALQFMSNGFKVGNPGTSNASLNGNGQTYIYIAFAEDPVKYSNGVATLGDGNEFIQDANYPEDNFSTTTYSGSIGNDKFIETGVNADLIWWKNRDTADNHQLYDTVRGDDFASGSNLTDAQYDYSKHPNGDLSPKILENGFRTPPVENNGINDSGRDMVAWSWKAAGHEYKSADFNGSSSYINLGNSIITGAFSLSFWVNTSNITTAKSVFDFENSTYDAESFIQNGIVYFRIYAGGTTYFFIQSTLGDISINTWHNITYVFPNTTVTDGCKIYIDGVEAASGTSSAGGLNLTSTIQRIGSRSTNTLYWLGKIDQVRVFNKAITLSEVTALYDETKSTVNTLQVLGDSSCIATYRLNGDALDLSGNYNGTESNINYKKGSHFAYNIYENKARTFSHKTSDLSLDTGTITPSGINANRDNGFSIIKWTGNGISGSKINHGLSRPPEIIITKGLSNPTSWVVGIGGLSGFGVNDYLTFTAYAKNSSSTFYQAYNTDTFKVGVSSANEMNKNSSNEYISYCWHSVPGFSKIGSYTGNGGTNNIAVDFLPRFIMIKNLTNNLGWYMFDVERKGSYANVNRFLRADTNAIEGASSSVNITFTNNNIKIVSSSGAVNNNTANFLYFAIA